MTRSSSSEQTQLQTMSDDELDKRFHELQERLRRCQRRQRVVEESKQEVERVRTCLSQHRNELEQERQASRADLLSLRLRHTACQRELQRSVHWNIVNDCFHIWWHPKQAAFATINGIRLGAQGPPPIHDKMKLMDSPSSTKTSSQHHDKHNNNNKNNNNNSNSNYASSSASASSTVGTLSPHHHKTYNNNSNSNNISDDVSVMSMATTTSIITASMDLPRRYLGFGSQTTTPNNNNNNNNDSTATTATILSSSASVMDSSIMSSSSKALLPSSQQQQQQQHHHPNHSATATLSPKTTTPTAPVMWTEINSALGQVCLLLSVVEQNPHAGISYPHHVLFPCGSTSKIGYITKSTGITLLVASPTTTTTMYQLYYSEDISFPLLFGKKSTFNSGLQALCECLANAAMTIQKRDRTITLPYPMINTSSTTTNAHPQWKIGGISVQYNADQRLAWTRVMKYLLTNCKWVVAYVAKHVDR